MLIALSFLAFAGIIAFVVWCAAVLAGRADRYIEYEQSLYSKIADDLERELSEYGAPEGDVWRNM